MASAVLITVNGFTAVIPSNAAGPQGPPGPAVTPGAAGQFYVTNAAATAPEWKSISGDVTDSAVTTGQLTVVKINGHAVGPNAVSTGNVLTWDGSAYNAAAVNLAGGATYVTGVLPTANQANQALGGDLSGTTNAGLVRLANTSSHVDLGGTVSGSGSIRNANATTVITARNTANSADLIVLSTDSSDNILMGSTSNTTGSFFFQNNGVNVTAFNSTIFSLNVPIALSVGGNNAAAGDLRMRNTGAINFRNAANSADVLGLSSNAANQLSFGGGEVLLDCTSTTAPFLQSYTTATSLTVGTNKSGAALNLQGDAAATALSLTTAVGVSVNAMTWAQSTTPAISQAASAGGGTGMSITAQAAAGTNDGGGLTLAGGQHAGSSTVDGSVKVTTPFNPGFVSVVSAVPTNLNNVQSAAMGLLLTAGAGGAFQVNYLRRITDTSMIIVRNTSGQTATIAYLTGGTVTVATATSAIIFSDGTNLQKMVVGT